MGEVSRFARKSSGEAASRANGAHVAGWMGAGGPHSTGEGRGFGPERGSFCVYADFFLRRKRVMAASPNARAAMVPGSGATTFAIRQAVLLLGAETALVV